MLHKNPQLNTDEIPQGEILARIVMGTLKSELKFPSVQKHHITARLEPDLYQELEFFKKQSGKSLTEIIQLLLKIGVADVRKHMALDGQMEIPEVKKAVKK